MIELLSFLGHASADPTFDDCLLSIGIEARPKKNESTVYVDSNDGKLVLTFQGYKFYEEESLAPPRSEGKFIFRTATFKRGFSDALPYGLNFDNDPEFVTALLGRPKRL
ncbi:hypothetical protein LFL96_06495 [Paraburkholderia sp. D15]|uniref:hypothetical protein n=1 Tax=Paraburkholderia sp. D15 TaxID=2880218 RepID=UPI0024783B0E|nr:hypothetical protein [Paraburkholderia sp. D15]WGS51148.1 hypothetical protein LFL96_06495 [Paraburkholderia sp. D15]